MASTMAGGDALATLTDLGYDKELAEQALKESDGCVDSAIDALFLGRVGKKKLSVANQADTSDTDESEVLDGSHDSGEEPHELFDGSVAWVVKDNVLVMDDTIADEEAPPVKVEEVENPPSVDTQGEDNGVDDDSPKAKVAVVEESEAVDDVEAPSPTEKDSKQQSDESPPTAKNEVNVAPVIPVGVNKAEQPSPKPSSASMQTEDLLVDVAADDDEIEFTDDLEDTVEEKDVGTLPVVMTSTRKTAPVETPVVDSIATSRSSQTRSKTKASNKHAPPKAAVAAAVAAAPDEEAPPLPEDSKPSDTPVESGNWWSKSSDVKKIAILLGGLAILLIVILAIAIPVSRNNNNNEDSPPAPSPPVVGGDGTPTSDPGSSGGGEPTPDSRSREAIAEMLASISPDGGIALNTANSAQDTALTWLMGNANLVEYSDTKIVQRYVLATLFYATNGQRWKDKWGWLTDADECDPTDGWFQSKGALEETLCNEEGKLTQLKLIFNRIDGQLPAEIGLLGDSLETLDFASNALAGPIPESIGDLTGLHTLVITGNQLSGNIPASIGQLTGLERLWLYGNELSGPIPPEIGSLVNLKQLSLVWNKLSSSIPNTVGQMTSLVELWLYENELSGSIPIEVTSLTSVERLWLYSNNLNGSIPESIVNMTSLTDLRLHNNTLGGRIPDELNDMPNLNSLWLYDNNFGGSFSCDDSIDLCFIRCADFESFRDRCRKW